MQFGIHLQKNQGIHYSIQYSLIKILWYSVFNSVFTFCNFKVFSIQLSIQQAEVLSTQYSTQCSNQFSVFTQYSIHDGIWSIQYSMYSVFTYSLVSLIHVPLKVETPLTFVTAISQSLPTILLSSFKAPNKKFGKIFRSIKKVKQSLLTLYIIILEIFNMIIIYLPPSRSKNVLWVF